MAGKSGINPLWKKSDISLVFKKLGERAEWAIVELLKRTGEEFVKIARLEGNYQDWTGNLRSSIGYVIIRNGSQIVKDFKESKKEGTDKKTGKAEAERLTRELAGTHSTCYVLIGVAGMKYAVFVEAMENKDVLSRAVDKAEDFIRAQSRSLFNRLTKM